MSVFRRSYFIFKEGKNDNKKKKRERLSLVN